jgi:voltage-gated potassium channel
MRILRLLKFYRASPVAHIVMERIINQWDKIRLVSSFVLIITLFSGTAIHHLEKAAQPESFGSLWSSMWWTIVTICTVGYGDMYPKTVAGQAFGMLLMLTALGVVGALINVVMSAFNYEEEDKKSIGG